MRDFRAKLDTVLHEQQGYFTTKQALAAGYASRSHLYHVATGAWVREYRGIYRLPGYPVSPEGQYVLWSLWSCNRHGKPQGVYSHQTALSIHELSDVMPPRLHMIVPPTFRRMAALPSVLALHYQELSEREMEQRQGYRVVRPLRAMADLLREGAESPEFLRQAITQALARGLVTRAEIRAHPDGRTLAAAARGRAP
jgi:predicted transcriptional regulator of viral defense system